MNVYLYNKGSLNKYNNLFIFNPYFVYTYVHKQWTWYKHDESINHLKINLKHKISV